MPATTPISYLLDENVDVRLSDVLVRAGAVVTRVPKEQAISKFSLWQ